MLTDEMKKQIQEEVERSGTRKAGCIEAIQIVQQDLGWISDEVLVEVAEFLDMTPAELEGVASFYNHIYRKPVGKHRIMICASVSCWIMGYEKLLDHICQRLGIQMGQTTADGMFTLLPIQCLGVCEQAPALMIDEELYTHLDESAFDKILEKYREGG
jgi:NADH-quinone oxidoreductase subunit E